MPNLSVMIKPASGMCNMRCRYCFYADEMSLREISSYGMMTEETLENVIRKVIAGSDTSCTIAFQGGEPTLAGLDFFRKAVALQKKHNPRRVRINNAIQTNGYALTEEWAVFFRENHFLVGVSVDGPKEIHDRYRVDAAGNGTYGKVRNTIALLEKHRVEFNILTVVTGPAAKNIGKIYGNFLKNGWEYQQYISCMDPLKGEKADYSLGGKEMGSYLCRLFDLWYRDAEAGKLKYNRTFQNLLQMAMGERPESCNMVGHCSIQYLVEADGSVYPCDFYALDEWKLGNLNADSIQALDRKREELGFIQKSLAVPEDCRQCRWYPLCRNGCRRDRELLPDGSLGKNIYCEGWKMFYPYAWPRIQTLVRKMR